MSNIPTNMTNKQLKEKLATVTLELERFRKVNSALLQEHERELARANAKADMYEKRWNDGLKASDELRQSLLLQARLTGRVAQLAMDHQDTSDLPF